MMNQKVLKPDGQSEFKINYLNSYDEGRPSILLIHGWGSSSGIWTNLTEKLALSFNLLTVDLPGHGEHADNTKDMHIWLDPANARLMVQAMVRALSEADKKNQSLYEANGKKLLEDLKKLEDEITRALTPVKNKPFIVFHDAFQYFERRFGLNGAGALMVHSGHSPSAKRLFEVRKKILQAGVSCVFREPQFDGRLAESVVRGTSAKIGILDPLGSDIAPGPTGYSQLIRSNAKNLSGCLKN